jgi:hypothetical protein
MAKKWLETPKIAGIWGQAKSLNATLTQTQFLFASSINKSQISALDAPDFCRAACYSIFNEVQHYKLCFLGSENSILQSRNAFSWIF